MANPHTDKHRFNHGAHGEHFFKDLLLGTTAEKVVCKGDRPVLVVKRAAHGPYRRVLVPVDFSESDNAALIKRIVASLL
jgi:nucleotide-binding universal stress UspA family protein